MSRKKKSRRTNNRLADENSKSAPVASQSAPNKAELISPDTSGMLGDIRQRSILLTFSIAVATSILLWLSFPPVGAWLLAWVAPVPLIWLVITRQLPCDRPYLMIWLSGLLYWLATFYFIPLPHPALFIGWIVVSLYMSIYTPLFVSISRILVHRIGIPVILAAPLVWTGIEWFRCVFATGMPMVCLSHTQYKQPVLIQIADLCGAYTLTFAVVMVSASLAVATIPKFLLSHTRTETPPNWRPRIASAVIATCVVAAVIGYGMFRLSEEPIAESKTSSSANVALIQSSIDIVLAPPSEAEMNARFEQYRDLTLAAREKWPELDLIVWPESSFPSPDLLSDLDSERTVEYFDQAITDIWHVVSGYPHRFQSAVPMLVGSTTHDPDSDTVFNAALLIENGNVTNRYFKNHRVMIGEYTPFAEWFPSIQELTPIGRGLTAGTEFKTFEIGSVVFTPSICFETTVPHLVRRQINSLAVDGREPDVILNITNDGWFFGTSCLDLHLACNVFRAVENRKTNLVCANTGFSAEINSDGRLVQVGPRRDTGILLASVGKENRTSLYRTIGDVIPMLMGIICIGTLLWNRFAIENRNSRSN